MDLKNIHHPLKTSDSGIAFSPDASLLADHLQKLADDIRSRRVFPQQVRLIQFAEPVT